ncbi:glycosyltransferase [Enterococcus faecium]|uniref:glycosyltransferase n=1 Tax=Enterococcus faecium TaxID=1352 RepID=UPI000F4EAD5C|nr:glycosyltransferase [Enterococcus faecium]MBD9765888.1 glycosyltransferase [Enterococcus faecium]MCV3202898.1 glycosyltransferase [Enterococcus faecium]MCV6663213.1 glycosyltransferase [Enterococcus faecium]ROX75944.1 glycosyltransferase [Enterococcus faecium]WOV50920.1 glycosyltransferase [Enterococcus faecium]
MNVSIIIPFYNAENHLENCLVSFLKQTVQNYEIVLVDDGSIDRSKEIISKFNQKLNIKYIYQTNRGVSAARNLGILKSKNRYLLFVDVDDTIYPTFVEKFMNSIKFNNQLTCCSYLIDYPLENKSHTLSLDTVKTNNVANYTIFQLDTLGVLNVVWNKCFDKEIIEKNDIRFDIGLKSGEDLDFVYKYCKYVKEVIIIEDALYRYIRVDGQSTLSKYIPLLNENLNQVQKSREEFYRNSSLPESTYKDFLEKSYIYNKMIVLNNCYKKDAPRNEKSEIVRQLLNDSYLKKIVNSHVAVSLAEKLFFCFIKMNKPILLIQFYNFLFWLRRNFNKIYKKMYPYIFNRKNVK